MTLSDDTRSMKVKVKVVIAFYVHKNNKVCTESVCSISIIISNWCGI